MNAYDFTAGFLIASAAWITIAYSGFCWELLDALLDRVRRSPDFDDHVDEAIALANCDRCEDCRVRLNEENEAITCLTHRLCVGCDTEAHRCHECARERRAARLGVGWSL